MEVNRRKWWIISLAGTVGFFFAIAPVLDPYIVIEIGSGFTLKINDIIMLFLTMLCFSKSYRFERKTGFLCMWLLGLGIIGIFGNLVSNTDMANSFKNLIVWLIYAFCLTYLWKTPCRDKFFQWMEIIAIVASMLVILQFVSGYVGIAMWDGKIPGLALGKYDGWAGYIDINTGDIRPNGIFQEASYLGIYVSVAYVQAFKEEKIKRMLLYAIAMLMTTSVVAIIILITTTVLILIMKNRIDLSSKMTRRILFLIGVFIVGLVVVSNTNEAVADSIAYIMRRFTNFNSDLNGAEIVPCGVVSTIFANVSSSVELFSRYSILQKMVGVGIAQYGNLFNVKSYGNVWVTTLLNCGILGVGYLITCVLNLVKRIRRENIAFFVIFVLVLSSDWQWFSWYFFMLISACILSSNDNSERVAGN